MTKAERLAKEGRIAVKLVLDADVVGLLPKLAGSSRKQGEYVSKLIRAAAARSGLVEAEQADVPTLRRLVMELIRRVEAVEHAGQEHD